MARATSARPATSKPPILSAKARKRLAMQACRRYTSKWLQEQGWKVRVMGVPVLVATGRTDTVKYKVELLFIGDPT
jgi:predicted GTPase